MENRKRKDGSPMNHGINNNTYKLLFGDFYNLPENERKTYENVMALATIERFTKLQEMKIFTKLLKMIYKRANIDLNKITYNKEIKQFEYRDNDKVITFDRLSDYFSDKDIKRELMSNKRYGKCHIQAINIAPSIKGSRIVTGYVTTENSKVLHSIIEYDIDNKTVVLDWTRNLCTNKDQYVELTKFVELSSFEGREVIDDIELITGNLDIGVKSYVVFREELMRDIKKNPQIFQPTEEGRKKTENFRREEKSRKDEEISR